MVLDGEGVYEMGVEGDLEDFVKVLYDYLAGYEVVIEIDVGVDDLVIGDHAFSFAVLAEIGVAFFEELGIGHVFGSPEEMGLRRHIVVIRVDRSVVRGLDERVVRRSLCPSGEDKLCANEQAKPESFGY